MTTSLEKMNTPGENETSNSEVTSVSKTANLNSMMRNGYMRKYESFIKWKELNGATSFSEEVFLDYFKDLSKSRQPSTLWAVYSMLKATVSVRNNIQISKYRNLTAFIKEQAVGHKSRQSRVFSALNVATFLKEAPDHNYLAVKVALIFGVNGGCRNNELLNIRVNDVQKHSDQLLLVNVRSASSPTKLERSFMILDKEVKIVEKYIALRPKKMPSDRFFVQYHFGKCKQQVIGINNFRTYPWKIASFLKLPNPKLYSGHCLRRTAAALRAESDLTVLEELGLTTGPGFSGGSLENKTSESASTMGPHVAVKVERADSEVPFDFIAVEETAPPPQPSPPPPRRRPRPHPLLRITQELQQRRFKLDEEREREQHERDMERLRERARRVEADAECNAVLRSVVDVALAWMQRPHGNGYLARHG